MDLCIFQIFVNLSFCRKISAVKKKIIILKIEIATSWEDILLNGNQNAHNFLLPVDCLHNLELFPWHTFFWSYQGEKEMFVQNLFINPLFIFDVMRI